MNTRFDWKELLQPGNSIMSMGNQPTNSNAQGNGMMLPGVTNSSPLSSGSGGFMKPGNQYNTGGLQGQSLWDKFTGSMLGSTDTKTGIKTDGWGNLALGAAQGIGGAYLGMKQYGLAQDKFKETKRQFNKNYESQKTLTNGQLEDRQRARVASNPGAYASVGDYMKKNGVK